jgi:hypothetical protein
VVAGLRGERRDDSRRGRWGARGPGRGGRRDRVAEIGGLSRLGPRQRRGGRVLPDGLSRRSARSRAGHRGRNGRRVRDCRRERQRAAPAGRRPRRQPAGGGAWRPGDGRELPRLRRVRAAARHKHQQKRPRQHPDTAAM